MVTSRSCGRSNAQVLANHARYMLPLAMTHERVQRWSRPMVAQQRGKGDIERRIANTADVLTIARPRFVRFGLLIAT